VYLVPAFVGLGAPHWEPAARGLICGLTLDSRGAHLVRAALESVAYQTLDLTAAMAHDGAQAASAIRVDGGMAANDWFCQFLADVLDAPVERTAGPEATVAGAARLAGLAAGVWPELAALAAAVETPTVFTPRMSAPLRAALIAGWHEALGRALPGRTMADATHK
jgi:glycerol kinase